MHKLIQKGFILLMSGAILNFVLTSYSISALSRRDRSAGSGTLFWLGLYVKSTIYQLFPPSLYIFPDFVCGIHSITSHLNYFILVMKIIFPPGPGACWHLCNPIVTRADIPRPKQNKCIDEWAGRRKEPTQFLDVSGPALGLVSCLISKQRRSTRE